MKTWEEGTIRGGSNGFESAPEELPTRELLGETLAAATALVRQEIELARAEIAADLHAEVRTAKALGVGVLLGLCGLTLVFVTLAAALALIMPAWAACLLVTALVLGCAGALIGLGWAKRVRRPLQRTRRHLRDDLRWMKERLT